MTIKNGMMPVHPGEVLREELDDLGLSANALAKAVDVPVNRITGILNGERGVSADTALRLGRYFDTTAQFWMNLQQTWQIRLAEMNMGQDELDKITSRYADAIRITARQAQHDVFAQAASALKAMEHNISFCEQLGSAERCAQLSLRTFQQDLRALVGPLDELREVGILDTVLSRELDSTRKWLAEYESRFRLPEANDLSRLIAPANVKLPTLELLEAMKSPWLEINDEMGSIKRMAELHNIGELVRQQSAFSESASAQLRASLGDWRGNITWPRDIWQNFGARANFYGDLGFDTNLTALPAPAFREAVSDIRSEPPALVESYGLLVPPAYDPDEEAAFVRTNQAHDWLQRFESQLRRFIDTEMTRVFGPNWPRGQLPNGIYPLWMEKSEKDAARTGTAPRPLIAYADFTDYARVITRKDNWKQVFGTHFQRQEDVRESLQRLHPIRMDTMHARPIGQDDELLLYCEVRRLMCAISV